MIGCADSRPFRQRHCQSGREARAPRSRLWYAAGVVESARCPYQPALGIEQSNINMSLNILVAKVTTPSDPAGNDKFPAVLTTIDIDNLDILQWQVFVDDRYIFGVRRPDFGAA